MSEAAGEVAPLSLCLDVDERGNLTSIDMGAPPRLRLDDESSLYPFFIFKLHSKAFFFSLKSILEGLADAPIGLSKTILVLQIGRSVRHLASSPLIDKISWAGPRSQSRYQIHDT